MLDEFKARVRLEVHAALEIAIARETPELCREVARYLVLGGGHRWRAMVAIASGEIFDDEAFKLGLPGACAVELAHAATLILDDLPSMDNGELRRGRACSHRLFKPWIVDLAPVFLVNLGYRLALENELVPPERRVASARTISQAALTMISGQESDMEGMPIGDERALLDCYTRKSGVLYAGAGRAGAESCGASDSESEQVYAACLNLGLSYQIFDDIADVSGSKELLGKNTGADKCKWTSIDLFGVDGARKRALGFQEVGIAHLCTFGRSADRLRGLIREAGWAPS